MNHPNFLQHTIVLSSHHTSIDKISMDTVIVSSQYQIVIPQEIRESMGIVSGQKIQMIAYRNRIELIPLKPIAQMRGFLKGIETEVVREGDRV
nr:AbrB/MazE/SpoVT family DNA-binding domain-containing protein [Chamaesiphon sp. VAR_69_metabat_338]